MTIQDLKVAVETGLEALRAVQLNPEAEPAKEFLVPDGLSPVIQLVHGDDLRKKRSTAAAWNWNPLVDKVIVSFRPSVGTTDAKNPSDEEVDEAESSSAAEKPATTLAATNSSGLRNTPTSAQEEEGGSVTAQEIIECCQALAQAEKSNRHFIALKWFRDELLATVGFSWAQSPQRRQQVLTQAIAMGRIDLKKVPNPKLPDYPTTAINLNRSIPIPGVTSRFNPVPIRGEAGSVTLLADRGSV